MRTFSEISRSFGRSSRKQEKQDNDEKKASLEPYAPTIAEDDAPEPVPASTNPTEDLLAICDTLVRPPSQDISRPFDNIPSPRLSESRSSKQGKKKRKSLVPAAPPTLQIESSLTPFGDAFRSFVEEPKPSLSVVASPPAATTTTTIAAATIAAPAAAAATTVNAAESDETSGQRTTNTQPTAVDSTAATISTKNNAESRFSASPVPSKEKPPSSPLKAFFGGNKLKNRLSAYWSPEQTTEPLPIDRCYSNDEKLAAARATSPTPKGDKELGQLGKKGSNEFLLSRGFGSIKKLTSRS
ncbi:4974_t:CDS:2, partial [Acaulospora colombiana]